MRRPAPTMRLMMGAIALIACFLFTFFRLGPDPTLGVLLVSGSIVALAVHRVVACLACAKSRGSEVRWGRLGILIVTSLAASSVVIGAGDLVFLAVYCFLDFVVLSLDPESDGRPPEPIAPAVVFGLPLALLQAYLLRLSLWPSARRNDQVSPLRSVSVHGNRCEKRGF